MFAKESHHCTNVFACLISAGQGNIFAGGGCCHDELLRASLPVKENSIQVKEMAACALAGG